LILLVFERFWSFWELMQSIVLSRRVVKENARSQISDRILSVRKLFDLNRIRGRELTRQGE
jgi:hypothetical protein